MTDATTWPTLGSRFKSWSGTCHHCGEPYPADTRILAVWSPAQFQIACRCSPREWVSMQATGEPQ